MGKTFARAEVLRGRTQVAEEQVQRLGAKLAADQDLKTLLANVLQQNELLRKQNARFMRREGREDKSAKFMGKLPPSPKFDADSDWVDILSA